MRQIFPITIVFLAAFLPSFPLMAAGETNLDFFLGSSQHYRDVLVSEVLRADTFVLDDGEVIRMIGVRALGKPVRKKEVQRDKFGFVIEGKASPLVPLGEEALAFVRDLLEGQRVRLEFDAVKKDDEFHTWAYVFLAEEGTFVNTEILRQGFGSLHIQAPNTQYAPQLREAYRQAQQEKRGLHRE